MAITSFVRMGAGRWRLAALAAVAASLLAVQPAAADEGCTVGRSVLTGRGVLAPISALLSRGQLKILAIGSSSTSGIGASGPAATYPAILMRKLRALARRDAVEVENAGVAGEIADQTIARLQAKLADGRYDLVIWQVGTNDAVRGGDEGRFREQLDQGLAAIRRSGAGAILIDQQFYPAIPDHARYERYVRMVGETGARHGVPVLSRYDLMRAWAERSGAELRSMLAGDGFHMSDRGYDCIAEHLAAGIAGAGQPVAAAPRAVVAAAD